MILESSHHFCAVTDLWRDNKLITDLPHDDIPILYRWWFSCDSEPMKAIEKYLKDKPDDEQMHYLYHSRLKKKKIGKDTYGALYFGKSINGRKRFRHHINGPLDNSTLRRTLYALLFSDVDTAQAETKISDILSNCYYEWIELSDDKEMVDMLEMTAISLGKYPLNMDGNPAISEKWREHLMDIRKLK